MDIKPEFVLIVVVMSVVSSIFFLFIRSVYREHVIYKLNMRVIGIYDETLTMTEEECWKTTAFLQHAWEKGADIRYVNTAGKFVDIRLKILKAYDEN